LQFGGFDRTKDRLRYLIALHRIPTFTAFSDDQLDYSFFSFLGPAKDFYVSKLQYFTDQKNLVKYAASTLPESVVNEVDEGNMPCEVIDEKNDDSAENQTSVLTQFIDSSNKRYLFPADAGVDSFEDAKARGFDLTNFCIVQLPHHGSRRNMNTNWVCDFNPNQFWVSADGATKTPRKALIQCIKKNLPNCKTYSTHKGGTKHINSNNSLFPARNWSEV
jgi:beta-lactamase superfamily II metal-dependent hydrolase